jgi:DNA-binding transcriptional LysR family regulator
MPGVLKESGRDRGERLGPGLQDGLAAALDLLGAVGEGGEELVDGLTDLGFSSEAGVGGYFLADRVRPSREAYPGNSAGFTLALV